MSIGRFWSVVQWIHRDVTNRRAIPKVIDLPVGLAITNLNAVVKEIILLPT